MNQLMRKVVSLLKVLQQMKVEKNLNFHYLIKYSELAEIDGLQEGVLGHKTGDEIRFNIEFVIW